MENENHIGKLIASAIETIIVLGIIIFFAYYTIKSTDLLTAISLSLFAIILIPAFIHRICDFIIVVKYIKVLDYKKEEHIKDVCLTIMTIIFWSYWFGFLAFVSVFIIKKFDDTYDALLITIPFALLGLVGIKMTLFKKKKKN